MPTTDFAPGLTVAETAALDAALERVSRHRQAWVAVPITERARLLRRVVDQLVAVAPEWVAAACAAKGIEPGSAGEGEEWISGPVTTIRSVRLVADALDAGGSPRVPAWRTRPDGQRIARVFPLGVFDRLAYMGVTVETWVEPGRPATQGAIYREPAEAKLCLVLAAGNIASIGPLDVLDKLIVRNEVVVVKMNPVNAYLAPLFGRAFAPFIEAGFIEFITGGAEVGRYVCTHPLVESIHLTGSDRTHDAIVWGDTDAEQQERKAAARPRVTVPVTSELGSVTPMLVVPGRWTPRQVRFAARHVASMVAHNASFNCNAGKVLVLARGWAQRRQFLDALADSLATMPSRRAYYPGAHERYQAFVEKYPQARAVGQRGEGVVPWTLIPDVPARAGEYALTTEAFCGVLAETSLEVSDAASFLSAAVPFANDAIWGSLSCVVLIDPATRRRLGQAFDDAIAGLCYGNIGVNVWTGLNFGIGNAMWGAYPGNRLDDIGSGIGFVHNALLIDHPQKSVAYGPFVHPLTPVWFADHRTLAEVGRRAVAFEASPSMATFLPVALAAARG